MEPHIHKEAMTADTTECPACGFVDSGRFCSNCGGVIKDYRINFMYWVNQILEWEEKVTHTTIQLLVKPAAFLSGYMGGNRARTYIPFKYLFFTFGLFCLVNEVFNLHELYADPIESRIAATVSSESEAMFQHILGIFGKFFILFFIPYYLLVTKLLHRKSSYNLAERATAVTYMLGMLMMVQTLFALITVFIHPFHFVKPYLVIGVELYMVFILAYRFYKEKLVHAIWKTIVCFIAIFYAMSLTLRFVDFVLVWWFS